MPIPLFKRDTVVASIIGGVFLVIAALVTSWYDGKENALHELIKHTITRSDFAVAQLRKIEDERNALRAELSALADKYQKLSLDQSLTQQERDFYKKLYDDTIARLRKLDAEIEDTVAQRRQLEQALEGLKGQMDKAELDYVAAIQERDQYKSLAEQKSARLVADSILYRSQHEARARIDQASSEADSMKEQATIEALTTLANAKIEADEIVKKANAQAANITNAAKRSKLPARFILFIKKLTLARSMDNTSLTDALVQVKVGDRLIGQTNEIQDNNAPEFNSRFNISGYAGEPLTLTAYDLDLTKHELIGQAILTEPRSGKFGIMGLVNGKSYELGQIEIAIESSN